MMINRQNDKKETNNLDIMPMNKVMSICKRILTIQNSISIIVEIVRKFALTIYRMLTRLRE